MELSALGFVLQPASRLLADLFVVLVVSDLSIVFVHSSRCYDFSLIYRPQLVLMIITLFVCSSRSLKSFACLLIYFKNLILLFSSFSTPSKMDQAMDHSPSTQNAEAAEQPAAEPTAQAETVTEKTEPVAETTNEPTNEANSSGQGDQAAQAPKKEVSLIFAIYR